ncbi:Crp/Fnr family transcriptional regulator [Arenicella sp. 4NH20-0111]|uniref:Crp/Fnr family transcriptional regulator n=1 Tax=Arenicella sp. 4NH20-0111 TaxID=3127648 RepID=UPI003105D362
MDRSQIENIVELAQKGWFQGVPHDEASQLVQLSSLKALQQGEFVYMIGSQPESVFCILEGQVKLSIIDPSGEELVLTIWEKGRWFGEASFEEHMGMPLEAQAITDASILVVPISVIEQTLSNTAPFYKNIMLDIIARAKLLYQLVETLMFKPLNARVATRVLHLVELFGQDGDEGVVLPVKFSQSDFARMSGGSRQRVNQIFRRWGEEGIIVKRNNRYVITDVGALREESEIRISN